MKYILLIYRICWKIEAKKLYVLSTKCMVLNEYLFKSMENFLDQQVHVYHLYKQMTEGLIYTTETKDSLDIMLEMNMKRLLKHPIIVEVINLVNEGEYSVDISNIALSETFNCLISMETNSLKSITQRMVRNIRLLGKQEGLGQASLQLNIWKQSIQ